MIIEQLLKDPHKTNKELSSYVGISERKIRENIRKLKAYGILKRHGGDKGGSWEVIK